MHTMQASLDGQSVHYIYGVSLKLSAIFRYKVIIKSHTRETVTQDIVGTHAVGVTTP